MLVPKKIIFSKIIQRSGELQPVDKRVERNDGYLINGISSFKVSQPRHFVTLNIYVLDNPMETLVVVL